MNLRKLRAKLVEQGMSVDTIAAIIGLNRSSVYRKFNNFEKITIGEAKKIKEALGMTDEEANQKLKWDSNRTALFELNCRIKASDANN